MPSAKLRSTTFLPSVFTSGNLFCGMLAIIEGTKGHTLNGAWLVVLASLFDGIDGMVARLTGHTSRFGVEFDSLSDVISFVLAPALLAYLLALQPYGVWGILATFCFAVTGTIRLARFNVSQKNLQEKGAFQGLPTPTTGGAVASYIIFCYRLSDGLCYPALVPLFMVLLSLLMISQVKYPALPKLAAKSFRSYVTYLVLLLAVIGIVLRPQYVLFPLVGCYILYGLARAPLLSLAAVVGSRRSRQHKIKAEGKA